MSDLFEQGIENWVKDNWLKERFGKEFRRMKVRMQDKGHFEFDAVDEEKDIVAIIFSFDPRKRSSVSDKKMNLRADCLMLSLANAEIKLLVITDLQVYKLACREQDEGRLPGEIKLLHVNVPRKVITQ